MDYDDWDAVEDRVQDIYGNSGDGAYAGIEEQKGVVRGGSSSSSAYPENTRDKAPPPPPEPTADAASSSSLPYMSHEGETVPYRDYNNNNGAYEKDTAAATGDVADKYSTTRPTNDDNQKDDYYDTYDGGKYIDGNDKYDTGYDYTYDNENGDEYRYREQSASASTYDSSRPDTTANSQYYDKGSTSAGPTSVGVSNSIDRAKTGAGTDESEQLQFGSGFGAAVGASGDGADIEGDSRSGQVCIDWRYSAMQLLKYKTCLFACCFSTTDTRLDLPQY
jgi:hypothetical protein